MCQQYDTAVQTVLAYLVEQGFSRTARKDFQRASKEFGRYLERGCLKYSSGLARAWLDTLKPSLPKRQFLSFRRSLSLVDDAARNRSVTTVWFSYDNERSRYHAPDCCRSLLDAFLEQRKQDGMQRSTLQTDLVACTRFLLFLRSREITDVGSITPEIVKEYQTQAEHHTAESSNAYVCRIRGFVRFLATQGLVPETLELAFATEKATRVSIVTTLSEEQVNTIRIFAENSRSPAELRRASMTMLALRMGLRSVDICNLRLPNIAWKSRTISIVQQKTGVPLTLPFPTEVGNLLARYILEGRPKCDEPFVFITLKHPYTRLTSSSCYSSSKAILGRKKIAVDLRGLHIARRTFASNLLAAGIPVSIIAHSLGHANESRVDEYLSTDEQRMRECAIGLSGIEIAEART
jgi:site-specific recombinase XerD